MSRYSILPRHTDTLYPLISICFLVYSQQEQSTPEVISLVERYLDLAGRAGKETRAPILALTLPLAHVCNLGIIPPPAFLSLFLRRSNMVFGFIKFACASPRLLIPTPLHLALPKRLKPMPIALMRPRGRTRRLFLISMTD